MITTLNGVGGLRSPESISRDNNRDCIGTQFLPLFSSSDNWAFSQLAPQEFSDLDRENSSVSPCILRLDPAGGKQARAWRARPATQKSCRRRAIEVAKKT